MFTLITVNPRTPCTYHGVFSLDEALRVVAHAEKLVDYGTTYFYLRDGDSMLPADESCILLKKVVRKPKKYFPCNHDKPKEKEWWEELE